MSALATQALQDAQERLNITDIDVSTRWNSTLDMLERALLLYPATMAVITERRATLSHLEISLHEYTLVEAIIQVLKPFKLASQALSAENVASIGSALPLLKQLKAHLSTASDLTQIQLMQRTMKEDLAKRCTKDDVVSLMNTGTLLDPRFKSTNHLNTVERDQLLENVASEMVGLRQAQGHADCEEDEHQPQAAKKSKPSGTGGALASLFSDDYFGGSEEPTNATYDRHDASAEVSRYLGMARFSCEEDSLLFWKANASSFPVLSLLARKYLAIQPSSVASERLFSSAGNIICAKRNRLNADLADKLIFLSKNLS